MCWLTELDLTFTVLLSARHDSVMEIGCDFVLQVQGDKLCLFSGIDIDS